MQLNIKENKTHNVPFKSRLSANTRGTSLTESTTSSVSQEAHSLYTEHFFRKIQQITEKVKKKKTHNKVTIRLMADAEDTFVKTEKMLVKYNKASGQ